LQRESQFDEEYYEISKRTFQREILEIKSTFNIEINYNRNEKVYEIIENQNQMQNERLLEAFSVLDTLQLAQNFSNEILCEQRKSLGLENVFILLHAIRNQLELSFKHKKYWDAFETQKTLQPYVLKESKNRWYLIGLEVSNNQIRTFGLDRITEIEISKTKFAKPSANLVENLFQHSFGIIFEENPPQKVVLEFSTFQANYIKALPLHHSQKLVSEDKNYCVFEFKIYSTYDFIMEILSLGKEVKVLEPQSLRAEIKSILKKALKNY
jgi:predicted DNA-binding transcriptional regulator YafY